MAEKYDSLSHTNQPIIIADGNTCSIQAVVYRTGNENLEVIIGTPTFQEQSVHSNYFIVDLN